MNDKQVMGVVIVVFSLMGLFLAVTGFFD
jgi:hypothetical protein